jgi:hypothetical protein
MLVDGVGQFGDGDRCRVRSRWGGRGRRGRCAGLYQIGRRQRSSSDLLEAFSHALVKRLLLGRSQRRNGGGRCCHRWCCRGRCRRCCGRRRVRGAGGAFGGRLFFLFAPLLDLPSLLLLHTARRSEGGGYTPSQQRWQHHTTQHNTTHTACLAFAILRAAKSCSTRSLSVRKSESMVCSSHCTPAIQPHAE